jgi:uncharacterized protein YqeY
MNLKDKINDDLKSAMKSGDKIRLSTIRSIRAQILEFEKSGSDRDISVDDEIKMLTSAAKKRRDSIEQYTKAGRDDLADREKAELEIINSYLPEQLSPEDVEKKVADLAKEIGAVSKADFARLMPLAIKSMKGMADGKVIKEMVDKVLSNG